MTSHPHTPGSIDQVCADVKRLGYGINQRIRLYGEEFELISDPFPEGEGIAVRVKTERASDIRVVQIPATVLQSLRPKTPVAA